MASELSQSCQTDVGERSAEPNRWRLLPLAAACVLSLGVWAAFHRALGYAFVGLDVAGHVVDNPDIRGLTLENMRRIWTTWSVASYYPVRTMTFAMDYHFWELNPRGYKLSNILLHGANVLLLMLLLLRLRDKSVRRPATVWEALAAAWAAALFAVHPVVVEPVVWVSGREELLMAFGALACFHFHLTARRQTDETLRRQVWPWHVLSWLACAVACLSNAVAAIIPAVVTAWDLITRPRIAWQRIVIGTGPLWLLGITAIVLKKVGDAIHPFSPMYEQVTSPRWMVVLNVYWLNLKTLVWPSQLAIDYWNVEPGDWYEPGVLMGGASIVVTLGLLWCLRTKRRVMFGLLWFLLALAPAAQIMPHHIHRADRFLYLPLAGLALGLGTLIADRSVTDRRWVRSILALAAVIVLAGFVVRQQQQLPVWRNSVSLWRHCLTVTPDNPLALTYLANGLSEEGKFEEAIPVFERALEIDPNNPESLRVYANWLVICRRQDLRDYGRAVAMATRACELTGWRDTTMRRVLSRAYMNWGTAWKETGQWQHAADNYRRAYEADPSYEAPLFNLALLRASCPDENVRDLGEAVKLAEQATAMIETKDPIRLGLLAEIYAMAGRWHEAANTAAQAQMLARAADDEVLEESLRRRVAEYRRSASEDQLLRQDDRKGSR